MSAMNRFGETMPSELQKRARRHPFLEAGAAIAVTVVLVAAGCSDRPAPDPFDFDVSEDPDTAPTAETSADTDDRDTDDRDTGTRDTDDRDTGTRDTDPQRVPPVVVPPDDGETARPCWPMADGNPRRTGQSRCPGPGLDPEVRKVWSREYEVDGHATTVARTGPEGDLLLAVEPLPERTTTLLRIDATSGESSILELDDGPRVLLDLVLLSDSTFVAMTAETGDEGYVDHAVTWYAASGSVRTRTRIDGSEEIVRGRLVTDGRRVRAVTMSFGTRNRRGRYVYDFDRRGRLEDRDADPTIIAQAFDGSLRAGLAHDPANDDNPAVDARAFVEDGDERRTVELAEIGFDPKSPERPADGIARFDAMLGPNHLVLRISTDPHYHGNWICRIARRRPENGKCLNIREDLSPNLYGADLTGPGVLADGWLAGLRATTSRDHTTRVLGTLEVEEFSNAEPYVQRDGHLWPTAAAADGRDDLSMVWSHEPRDRDQTDVYVGNFTMSGRRKTRRISIPVRTLRAPELVIGRRTAYLIQKHSFEKRVKLEVHRIGDGPPSTDG